MPWSHSLALAAILVPAVIAQEAKQGHPLPPDRADGAATITTEDLKSWLTTLTSEEYGGRETGTEGFRLAATLVREHFKSLGLLPYGDQKENAERSYWQSLKWNATALKDEETWLKITKGGQEVAVLGSGKGLAGRVSETDYEGQIVLVNVTAGDEEKLGELPLKGCVVLVNLRGSQLQTARTELMKAEPAGLLIVDDKSYAGAKTLEGTSAPGARTGVNPAARGRNRGPNAVFTSKASLAKAFEACGKDEKVLEAQDAVVTLAGLKGHLKVMTTATEAPAFNVVGVLPGSDPALKDEFVVIGSHLDHLGRPNGRLRPGADDDGSGTVGVLAVSRALAKNKIKPRRSVLFVTFCGEEMGLLGSGYFAKNSPIPLSSIAAELQMDMIGRDEEENMEGNKGEKAEDNRNTLHLIGTKKMSMDLHEICMNANDKFAGFELEWDQEGMFFRSDHYNFAKQGVPVAFFFTGLHHDYHAPTDTVDKINFPKLARVATYVYDIAFTLAQQDARPLIDKELWDKSRSALRGPETPAAPVKQEKGQ